jgi:hypothetical protein
MTPRPSSKRGRLWLNRVSTELGEGHYSFASPQPQLSDFILKDYLFPLPLPDGTGVFKVTS